MKWNLVFPHPRRGCGAQSSANRTPKGRGEEGGDREDGVAPRRTTTAYYATAFAKSATEHMRLKFIIPTAGCTCLTAVTAEGSAPPRDERNRNLRRNHKHRNASRKQSRELDAFDDDQLQLDLFNMGVATPSLNAPTMRPTTKPVSATQPSSRIKLYWQSGYYWQGDDDDPLYCMGTFFLRIFCECVIQMTCTDSHKQPFFRM